MAHFALTDSAGRRFVARERLTRGALGLAGASPDPLRVWVKDWSASGAATEDTLSVRLAARDDVIALDLQLVSTVPHVVHGDRGLDAKGAAAGNASYYYSIPRLAADGSVTVEGETFAVTGLAWLDREWSTSALEPGVVGWDWFALHLSDGGSLMFYRLRTASGEATALQRRNSRRLRRPPNSARSERRGVDAARALDEPRNRRPLPGGVAARRAESGHHARDQPLPCRTRSSTFRCATGRARCARKAVGPRAR